VSVWQVRSSAVQLLDDHSHVLVPEVLLFLDKVADGSADGLPGNNAVESGQCLPGQPDLGPRHPLLESGPVQVEIDRRPWSGHVQHNSMFINNEQCI
jgi:hypothetical protein